MDSHSEEANLPGGRILNAYVTLVLSRTRETAHCSLKSPPRIVHIDVLPQLYAKGSAPWDSDLTDENLGNYTLTRRARFAAMMVGHTDRAYFDMIR